MSIYAENTDVDDASSNEFANCDYSYVSESAWHGATLSLAEAFRNGVVPSAYVSKLVPAAIAVRVRLYSLGRTIDHPLESVF